MNNNVEKIDSIMLSSFLKKVNNDFPIPLEKKINIDNYSKKILNGTIVAYIENNNIIGLVTGYTENLINNSAYISIVAVDKEFRGRGIAKLLIKQFIDKCKKKNIESVNLYTHNTNKNAIRMYKELGFQECYNDDRERQSDIKLIYRILY